MKKRISMFIMSIIIIFLSIAGSYKKAFAFDIPTAFWGTIEAGRAMFTALEAGGGMSNGISLSKLEISSRDDIQRFQTQILIAYTAFCVYKEKIRIALEDPSLSENEVNEMATTSGTKIANDFKNNAINVNTSTKKMSVQDFKYWQEYCNNISTLVRNGWDSVEGGGSSINLVTQGVDYNLTPNTNIVEDQNIFSYNGYNYIDKGNYKLIDDNNYRYFAVGNVPSDRIRIPFIWMQRWNGVWYFRLKGVDINRLTGQVIYVNDYVSEAGKTYDNIGVRLQQNINDCNFPYVVLDVGADYDNFQNNLVRDYVENFSLKDGSVVEEEYILSLKNALDSTEVGKAIKEGGATREDLIGVSAVPIKRSSLKTKEETVEGVVGWDIPDTTAIAKGIADPNEREEEAKGMGIITVPENAITDIDDPSGVIAIPKDTPVSIPDTRDESLSVPIDDVISVQGGDFYPIQIDITEFFPFCIPFDIAYCVNKFHVSVGEAPIIHIPIVYPSALHGVLGESYDVIIDFNDYVVLRNVIRYFILLLFIVGLMQITRGLIRG